MEIFKNTNFDFLGKKWPFIIASLVLTVIGLASLAVKGGPRYGIDFRGGASVTVRFQGAPPVEKIRSALSQRIPGEITVQAIGGGGDNEVLIGTELKSDQELAAARQSIIQTLESTFAQPGSKPDFNNSGRQTVLERLRDPLTRNGVALNDTQLQALVDRIVNFRDRDRSGLLTSFNQLSGLDGATPAVLKTLNEEFTLAPFAVKGVEVVGPKVGGELRKQAILATLYALGGMLVYIAFRFHHWMYGTAAVIAVFHDTIITIGFFSLLDKEISLTVIAALLTLVGYSMNDTIVTFDRIRENIGIYQREKFETLVNRSINQTLSRTILTSGLTFLTVLALWLFGGEVLNGFSFALVVGIIIGTYSSIFIASPIVVFWHDYRERRKKAPTAPAVPVSTAGVRRPAKAVNR